MVKNYNQSCKYIYPYIHANTSQSSGLTYTDAYEQAMKEKQTRRAQGCYIKEEHRVRPPFEKDPIVLLLKEIPLSFIPYCCTP